MQSMEDLWFKTSYRLNIKYSYNPYAHPGKVPQGIFVGTIKQKDGIKLDSNTPKNAAAPPSTPAPCSFACSAPSHAR
jgi:hypothetical protein